VLLNNAYKNYSLQKAMQAEKLSELCF